MKEPNPVGIYWMDGATARYKHVPDLSFSAAAEDIVLKFADNSGAPDESFHGASDDFGDIFISQADFEAGLDKAEYPGVPVRCGFKLPSGVYHINVHVMFSSASDSILVHRIALRELEDRSDKHIVSDAFLSVDDSTVVTGVLDAENIKTDGTRAFFIHLDAAGTTKKARWFMRIERTGD